MITDAITILYEWMGHCTITQKEFDRERDVIIKEIEKNNANLAREFYQLCQNNFYKVNPLRLPVIGYLEDFKEITRDELIQYYKDRYTASNMVLVVGGSFDESSIIKQIKETFGQLPRKAPPELVAEKEPKPFSNRVVEKAGNTSTTYWSCRFSTVDLYSQDLYTLDLLEFILGNGEDSLLYRTIVEEKKLAFSVRCASYTPSLTNGYFDITVDADYKNIEKIKEVVLNLLSKIKNGDIEEKFLEKAKKQKLSDDIFSVVTMEDRVSRAGQSVMYGHTLDFYDRYTHNFKNIRKQDIVSVANKYLDFDRAVYTILKPKAEKNERVTSKQKKSPHVGGIPEKVNLKNGLTILFYPETSLPRAYIKIFSLGGIRAEDAVVNGLGHVMTQLWGMDSQYYNKRQIKERIEGNGAHMKGTMGNNTFYYSLDCLSEDVENLLPLYFHTYLKPKFTKKEMDEVKRKTLNWLAQRKDDWYTYGSYLFKKHFFKDHPYALSHIGESGTIKAISLDQVKAHHNAMLNPEAMVITVFGDVDKTAVLGQIEHFFGSLKVTDEGVAFSEKLKPKDRLLSNKKVALDHPISQNVAGVFIVFNGVSYTEDDDSLGLDLVDSILSGMSYPGGRLHNILREKGYVYMVHANNVQGIEKGYFLINALSSPDKVEQVKTIIFEQIADIKGGHITDKEFEKAIAQMRFYYKDRVDGIDALSVITATDTLYERGFDYYASIDKRIAALKKADISRLAKKYLINPQIHVLLYEKALQPKSATLNREKIKSAK